MNNNLKGAKNIGRIIEKRLNEIGVFSLTELLEMTPVKAYLKICEQHPDKIIPVCYYLYSLQGGLTGTHWNDIPERLKKKLLKDVGKAQRKNGF
ncbi:TfoX/Sxy family DNA transformation protein [Niabella sp. 22666]|uniref:TfoX/Sxy family DNA transformation protein n=1 Tax=Niabella sp. 22666 TaxID=3453954 RepID=UPI003F87C416